MLTQHPLQVQRAKMLQEAKEMQERLRKSHQRLI
jgi:hypothetical protein